jgi:protein-S-isoprenylcysteine O-methyltransferase Ste14
MSPTSCNELTNKFLRSDLLAYAPAPTPTTRSHRQHQRAIAYAFVRHPIHSGILLALLGTIISIGTVQSCIGLAIIFVSFVRKLTLEEQWLCAHLGAEYEPYRRRVKALIPYVL